MDETYGFWLAESDWKNIDLLIYYLETGRADHLKEALLLLDQQKQTDQIVNAISAASGAIAHAIQTSINKLAGALSASLSVISAQLSALENTAQKSIREIRRVGNRLEIQNEEIISSNERYIKATEKQTEILENKIAEQISVEKLNSALIAQSNKTSEDLLNDLRYNQRYWAK